MPEEFAEVCAAHQMPAMALLDRDGVYGAPRFYFAAKKLNIKAHIGAEITSLLPTIDVGCPIREVGLRISLLPRVSLLCASREGYQNLCRLITRTKLRAPKYPASLPKRTQASDETYPAFASRSFASDLAEFADGLICMTGGDEGPLAHALAQRRNGSRPHTLEQLIFIYGRENVYVELQRHYNREQEARNQAAISLARSLGLPLLATQGAQYAKPEERQILDVFTCIRNHCKLDTAGRLLAHNSERYVKIAAGDAAPVCRPCRKPPPTRSSFPRGWSSRWKDLGYEFPRYPVAEGETMDSFLRERTRKARAIVICAPDKANSGNAPAARSNASWR